MFFHATAAAFSARSDRLSKFRNHLMSSVCAALIIAAAGSGANAQEVRGRYFEADGSKTDDLDRAKKSWRDDPEFNGNWGLRALNADAAYARGFKGTGTKIGVIDQPVWAAHREFEGLGKLTFITTQGVRTYTDPYLPVKAGDAFLYNGQIYIDGRGDIAHHGTHVAGIAAGARNGLVATSVNTVAYNNNSAHENFHPEVFGMQGVAYDAHIIAVDNGDPGPEDGVIKGNDGGVYAAAWKAMVDNHADIITNSWGIGVSGKTWNFLDSYKQFQQVKAILGKPEGGAYGGAIAAARSGAVVEFSAGNDGNNLEPDAMAGLAAFVPDIETNWLVTASLARSKSAAGTYEISDFSTRCGYTKYFCVSAPGSNIESSVPDGDVTRKKNGDILKAGELIEAYASFNGTSMAGPFASGVFGVLKQRYSYLANSEINTILKTTSTDLGEKGVDDLYGWGLPNLDKAMNGPAQFMSRFTANLPGGQKEVFSNDISDEALQLRKAEETEFKAKWEEEKKSKGWIIGVPAIQLEQYRQPILAKRQFSENFFIDFFKFLDAKDTVAGKKLTNALSEKQLSDINEVYNIIFYKTDAIQGNYSEKYRIFNANFADNYWNGLLNTIENEYDSKEYLAGYYPTKSYDAGLTKSGPGSLWLTGKNTYRGDTVINGGELGIGLGGSIVSASLINDKGLLTVDGTAATVTVNAGGQVKVNATGVTGDLALNGGFASVDGRSGAAAVNANGALGGIGTVERLAVHEGGVVAPGNSIGTLHVATDASFDKDAALVIQVAADGRSDRLEVAGKATLLGGVVTVTTEDGKAPLSPAETLALLDKTYTMLTAAGGVSGTFDTALPHYYFIGAALAYAPNDVSVSLARNTIAFADVGKTRNQKAAASGIESLGRGNLLYDTVAVSTVTQDLPAGFSALSGEAHASLRGTLLQDAGLVSGAASERVRAAFDGVAAKAAPVATPLAYGPEAKDKRNAGEPFDAATPAPAVSTTALWGQAYGGWSHGASDGNAAAYSRNTGGIVTGVDALIAGTWRLGVLAGYGSTSLHGAGSSVSADSYQVGVYGGTTIDALTLSLGTVLAHHVIDSRRTVAFGSLEETDTAGYSANTVQLFGEAAYRIETPYAALEPFAAAAYTHLKTSGFTETGGIAALSAPSSSTDLTTTTLGLRASRAFTLGNATTLTARGMVGWRHAYGDVTPQAQLAFASGGENFDVSGLPIAQDAALVEAGLAFDIGKATTLGLTYTGQFSSQVNDNSVKADLTVRF